MPSSGRSPLRLVPQGGADGYALPYVSFRDGLARITGGGSIRSHESRYPLLSYLDDDQILYGPNRAQSPEPVGKELLYERLTPVGSFDLGDGVLEGSIEVLRNGVPEHRYSFNPDTGELSFFVPVAHSERIDISYRSTGGGFSEGELIAASANSLQFSETFGSNINLGLRWNVTDASFTEERDEATGSVLVSGGSKWERDENLRLEVDGGVSVESPNTTGLRRFLGMNGGGVPVAFTSETMYPGAPGAYSAASPTSGPDVSHPGGRGKLLYKDMYDRSLAGEYILKKYDWDPPSDQVYNYGDRVGPYPASTGSQTEGDAMVLEYEIDTDEWVGGLVPLIHREEPLDLSRMEAITFSMKHIGRSGTTPSGSVDIYVVFGRLPEDLDDDGDLDEESSKYSDGFAFNHSPYGTMPVAPRIPWAPHRSMINGEDLDGNDILDHYAVGDYTVVKSAPASGVGDFDVSGTGWNDVTLNLSPEERAKLSSVSAVQVLVVEESGSGTASGRLLVSELSFLGSSFSGSGESGHALEIYETYLQEDTGDYDSLTGNDEAGLFNEADSGRARVSVFSWNDHAGTWNARAYGKPVDLRDYRKISFFMKSDPTVGEITLSVRNPDGEGLSVSFEPQRSGKWNKYTWKLDSPGADEVTEEGEEIPSSRGDYGGSNSGLKKRRNAEGVNRVDISTETTTGSDGSLYLDELFFHDPQLEVGGAGRSRLYYHRPGVVVGSEKHPLVHDLTYENQVQVQSKNFASGFLEPAAGEVSFANDLGFGAYEGDVALSYNGFFDEEKFYPSGGYDITAPLFASLLTLADAYREHHSYHTIEVDHSSSAKLGREGAGSLEIAAELSRNSLVLARSWSGDGRLAALPASELTISTEYGVENDEDLLPSESFGERYGSSFSLYLPSHTTGPLTRTTAHDAQFRLTLYSTTFRVFADLSTATDSNEEEFSLSESHSLGVGTSTLLAPESSANPSLSFTYTRNLETGDAHDESTGFGGDLGEAAERSGEQLYFWRSEPFGELWIRDTRKEFSEESLSLASAGYRPSFLTEFSLTPGSRLYHLIAPSNLSVELGRRLSRSYDSRTDIFTLDSTYRATALNLFGRLGRYSIFDWYRTEEISHSAGLSSTYPLSSRMSGTGDNHTINIGQFLEFQLNRGNTVTTDTSYLLELPDHSKTLEVKTSWMRRSPFERDFPFKKRLDPKETPSLVHEEIFDVRWSLEPANNSENTRYLLSHITAIDIGETGEAKAFARIGYERSSVEDESGTFVLHNLGGEVGIEVELAF